jgi:TatD DNase family protein
MRWADNHCHLAPVAEQAAETVRAAAAAGVERLVNVGTDLASSEAAARIAATLPGVWATAGIHPHDASTICGPRGDPDLAPIEALVGRDRVVAVGECGLDYHYDHSPRDQQRMVFAAQVALAHHTGATLVIHTREAWEDTFAILRAEGVPERTVFHCFTGGPEEARRCLDLGAHLSFSGIITFSNATDVAAAAALCPLDRLVVETDSPYLAPVPHRGERNRPALVPLVGAAVAAARGVRVEEVAEATWETTSRLYRLDP